MIFAEKIEKGKKSYGNLSFSSRMCNLEPVNEEDERWQHPSETIPKAVPQWLHIGYNFANGFVSV